jgi:KDO2-lipid IV(A) lauroyltransferase
MKNSIVVDFFGIPAATVSAPLKIIKSANCMTFFLNSYFDKGKLIIDIEEIELSDKSVEEFSNELNILIETKIKLHPSEYLWQHRRFKSTLGKEIIYK